MNVKILSKYPWSFLNLDVIFFSYFLPYRFLFLFIVYRYCSLKEMISQGIDDQNLNMYQKKYKAYSYFLLFT